MPDDGTKSDAGALDRPDVRLYVPRQYGWNQIAIAAVFLPLWWLLWSYVPLPRDDRLSGLVLGAMLTAHRLREAS